MKKPPIRTRLLGHPLAVLLALVIGGLGLYGWWFDHDQWLPGVFGFLLIGAALKASEEVRQYKALERAWDVAGGGGTVRRRALLSDPSTRIGGLIALVIILFVYLVENRHEPGYDLALGWLVIGSAAAVIGGGLWALVRRLRRPRRRAGGDWEYAQILVQRPLMPVPDLRSAYENLPPHCQRLLGIGAGQSVPQRGH